MKKRITTIALICSALLLLTSAKGLAAEPCTELILENCTRCHYSTRICEKLGKKSKRAWKSTMKRMVRYGLALDKDIMKEITNCLVDMPPETKGVCIGE